MSLVRRQTVASHASMLLFLRSYYKVSKWSEQVLLQCILIFNMINAVEQK